ncbi:hypothetical protein I3842_13G037000 [Carya illinoinensis]|uniref:Uncharacterized protein n=1 Tax=Carya illinoinensis TaxID=32201 RepID=A0A922AN58_CARIL|nr:hypothetical protein I3842_13G037000 [Carya illinoinensis]
MINHLILKQEHLLHMGNLQNKSNSTDESKADREINVLHPAEAGDHAPEKDQYYGDPFDEHSTARSTSNLITGSADSDTSRLKSGGDLLQEINNAGDMSDDCIHPMTAEKAVNPRLLTLLEFFRQLYVRKQEVFKTSFPDLHEKFDEIFKKDGGKVSQVKSGRMIKAQPILQRSMSVGSPREISQDDLKLERFKVRIIDVGGSDTKQADGKGGQDVKGGSSR